MPIFSVCESCFTFRQCIMYCNMFFAHESRRKASQCKCRLHYILHWQYLLALVLNYQIIEDRMCLYISDEKNTYLLVHLRSNNFSTERHTHIYLITYLAMKGGQIFRCVGIHGGDNMLVICINIWHGIIFKICKRISFKDDGLYSESTGCSRKRGVLTRFPIDLAEGLQ